jgi:hypothetical protein
MSQPIRLKRILPKLPPRKLQDQRSLGGTQVAATPKRHMLLRHQNDDSADSDEDGGDGAASMGHHPKFDRHRPVDQEAVERL